MLSWCHRIVAGAESCVVDARGELWRWPIIFAVVSCQTATAFADENAPPSPRSPILADSAVPAHAAPARPTRAVSPWVQSLLERSRPPFKPARPDDSDSPTDALRLPPIVVAAPKIKVPEEMQALSRAEFAARLRKEYPGASLPGQDPFRIEHGPPNYARLEYEEERRREKVTTLGSFADLLEKTGDRAAAERLRKELQNTSASTYKDPVIDAMDRSANGGRR